MNKTIDRFLRGEKGKTPDIPERAPGGQRPPEPRGRKDLRKRTKSSR